MVTLMNGLCGFAAIILASHGLGTVREPGVFPQAGLSFLALAGYLVFLGMVADVLDGHVARISQSTSSFGAQLDSLCDVISFGIAPAFLMVRFVEAYSSHLQSAGRDFAPLPERFVYLIAGVYVMCAIIRLARFNVETKKDDPHMGFYGLPTPPAAGVIVSLIVLQQDFPSGFGRWFDLTADELAAVAIWLLPLVTLAVGILMVSRIPYPHAVNRLFRGKKRFSTFLLVMFVIPLMIWNLRLAMAVGFCTFALFGPIRWLALRASRRRRKGPEAALAE